MCQSFKKVLSVIAAIMVGVSAFAQITTSSMSGKVTDKDGAIQGVVVLAVYTPTGSQFHAVTDAQGAFRIPNITAGGPYKVTFTSLGYNDVVYNDVNAPLADNVVLNAEMTEESFALEGSTVVAEGKTSNMRSDRAGAITTLGQREMSEVPTISRSLNDIIKQTPQATVSGSNAYIGGGNHRDSYVTIDGAAFNNAFGIGSNLPAGGSPISMDALEQMSISITPYDVRQSGFTGGGVSATTRSGTNQVKGTVYGYFHNQDMRGYKVGVNDDTVTERYIDKTLLESKTDSRYLLYGASVGAPIIKNKLFLFLNVEADKSVSPGPTSLLSNGTLNGNELVQGDRHYTNGTDNVVRPNAVVLDKLADYLKDNYGYDPGLVRGYSTETPSLKFLARLDWNINDNHKFNLRYSMTNNKYTTSPSTSTSGLATKPAQGNRTNSYAAYFQNARYWQEQNFNSIAGELNSRFLGGSLNNVFRFSYSHQYEPRSVDGGYFPFVDIIVPFNGTDYYYTSFGTELFSYGNLRDVGTTTITDELTWALGKHTFLAGAQYELDVTKNGFQRFGAGYYSFRFDSEQALLDAMANNTLFNNPSQFAITHGNNSTFDQEFPRFTFGQASLYLQDQINVSDNFKLTAGLRMELPYYPSLDYNDNKRVREASFAPTANNPEGKYNTVDLPKARLSLSPRVGFNWDITGDRTYVLRGGTGVFVGRIPFVWIVAQAGDAGVLQTTVTKQSDIPTISNDRNAILSQLYPSGFSPEAAGLNLTSITLMDSELRNPTSWKSSLAFDAQLPWGMKGTLEATYKKDINPITVRNIGLNAPTSVATADGVAARPYYNNGTADSQITSAYLLYNVTNPKLWGYYYSLTAQLEKSFSRGFRASVAYTYADSKVLNNGVGDQVYSVWNGLTSVRGANNPELGYASYVNPHRVIANLSYSKDYAKHFGTTVSLAYYGSVGRTHLTYKSNVIGDGSSCYNLIDIPTLSDLQSASGAWGEGNWTFKELSYTDANGNNQVYTAAQQAEDLYSYLSCNKYYLKHAGEVMERYGAHTPWSHEIDFKINQNFYFYTGANRQKHTLQFGFDVSNFANFLNPYWGVNTSTLGATLDLTNANAVYTQGAKPVFQYNRSGTEARNYMYKDSISSGSTWSAIFSVRYIF